MLFLGKLEYKNKRKKDHEIASNLFLFLFFYKIWSFLSYYFEPNICFC